MKKPLRVLMVEDNENDCLLLLRQLSNSGYDVKHERVMTAAAMSPLLVEGRWDVVVSDYSMPGFGAVQALELLQKSGLDLPFIIISGTIGEETAVGALKAGAHDFLLKSQLARLMPAIDREVREAGLRRDKRNSERLLRESELKYRQIVETAQEGIWMINGEGQTTFINKRMATLLNSDPEKLLGASFFDFLVEERRPLSTERRTARFRRRDGTEFWASLSTNPIPEPNSENAGALAMVTDITEQKKLQEQLMISDRMASVGTLAAGVAHEINNPLAVVMANLDLCSQSVKALRADPAAKELEDNLRDAHEAASRVRDVVDDLKIFSRAEEDLRVSVDIEAVLESSLRMAANEIRHRATVVRDFKPIPRVDANASRLGQVFLNLIVNASQAIEEAKPAVRELRLSTFTDATGRAVIECRDTGAGIPPDVLRRLFTPFFTTKAQGVGTGLGLSISHRIVASLGGEITVESELGNGSVFRVSLPPSSLAAIEPAVAVAPPPVPVAAPRRARLLVVDDEPMLLNVLRKALSQDYDVSITESPQAALNQVKAGARFDLILCDLMMPAMTGMELHARILESLPLQAERMVFLTGGAFTVEANAFLDRVSNLRVSKPFNLVGLKGLIAKRLSELPEN